jgi:hypothetical protein
MRPSRWRDRFTAVVAATGATSLLAGFFVLGTATSAQADEHDEPGTTQGWICKYVGKPGAETLRDSNNPMSEAVPSTITGGEWLKKDAQISYVLELKTDQNTGVRNEYAGTLKCPPTPPRTTVAVPDEPLVQDPCGPGNAVWVRPDDSDHITWTLEDGRLVAGTADGVVFVGGSSEVDFGAAVDSGEPCEADVAVPSTPPVSDPCGVDNAVWVVPADSAEISWVVEQGRLVAHTAEGVVFEGGSSEIDFGVAVDSGELCRNTPVDPGTPGGPVVPDKPDADVVSDTEAETDCESNSVVTTTTTTTTDWVLDEAANAWVEDEPEVATEVVSRPANEQECPAEVLPAEEERAHVHQPGEKPAAPDEVKGVEAERPEPRVQPALAERPEAVPTVVDAGIGPVAAAARPGPLDRSVLGRSLLTAGLLMLLVAGAMRRGPRGRGTHEL